MYNVIGMFRNKPGFTLIEMVITIGLVAILSAGVMSLIGPQPQRTARDTRRKADLNTIASAFEMYRNDCSAYPASYPAGLPVTYLASPPKDPKTNADYVYAGGSCTVNTSCGANLCKTFSIKATLEDAGTPTDFFVYNP
jgi:prepilin-type N-terminal cleavage/methylation domain-containing protein